MIENAANTAINSILRTRYTRNYSRLRMPSRSGPFIHSIIPGSAKNYTSINRYQVSGNVLNVLFLLLL